jgi:hypothetical protein
MRTTSRWLMPALSLVLFFGAIGVAQAAGWWVTGGREVVADGTMTSADLKGWMTIEEAADGLGVSADGLVALVGAPDGSGVGADTAFKDLEALVPGFDLTTYRERVEAYLDGADVGVGAVPTDSAAPVATAPVTTTPTATTDVPTGTPSGSGTGTPTGTPTSTPTGTPEGGIRGSMTLSEAAESGGVAVADLLAQAGLPADLDPGTVLRDIQNTVPGFELQTLRDALAALTG